jgi:signal transduction histidine kinase
MNPATKLLQQGGVRVLKHILFLGDKGEKQRTALPTRQLAIRLGLAFGILIALLITVGDLGLSRMNRINADLQEIMGRQWAKLQLAREMAEYSNRNSRITMEIFLLKDTKEIDTLLALRAENTRKISSSVASLERLCESAEEKRALAVVKEARTPYVESYQRALHLLVDERNRDAAVAVMSQQATPALLKYHAALDDFVRFEGDRLELSARQSGIRYTAARRLALFMIAIAVVVAGAISLSVIRRMVQEITARLQAEKEGLLTAHRQAEVFINAVPSILIGMNQDLQITRWNSAAARAFGLVGAEVLGKRLTECGVRWLRPDMPEEVQSWSTERGSRRCDRVPFEMKGETRLLGLTITSLQVAVERFTELLIIGSDVTERSALEVQLRHSQKLESVGQLAAGIAHEINTPTQYIGDNARFLKDAFQDLAAVWSSYERLLAAAKDNTISSETVREVTEALERADAAYLFEEIPKAIEQTLEGVTRVAKLVSAMKEFSHPGTKEKIQLDLNHAIENTITVARNEWKYVASMETDFDPALPRISCQPGEFNQVILNLIVNAAHAIASKLGKESSERGRIKIQTRDSPKGVEIRIQDTGSGIPANVQPRVFDPFFTTKEIGKGTGQGLAIARSVVVDKQGGTIHFDTEEGMGTTFIIRLPHDDQVPAAQAASA